MKHEGLNCLSAFQIATYPTRNHRAATWMVEESCVTEPSTCSYLLHPGSPWRAFGKQLADVGLGIARSQPGLLQYGAHVPRFISSVSLGL